MQGGVAPILHGGPGYNPGKFLKFTSKILHSEALWDDKCVGLNSYIMKYASVINSRTKLA
jgi:hypothetical protein